MKNEMKWIPTYRDLGVDCGEVAEKVLYQDPRVVDYAPSPQGGWMVEYSTSEPLPEKTWLEILDKAVGGV